MNESSVYAAIRVLVLLLVLLPLVWAVFVPLFGRAARRASLLLAILHLGITTAVIVPTVYVLHDRAESGKGVRAGNSIKFRPEFVPGSQLGTSHRDVVEPPNVSSNPTAGQPGPSIQFFLGVDGLNIWLVALASLMMIPAILVSWESIKEKPGSFYGWLFLLQGGAIGAFLSFDVILFYVFFELTLIPTFFLIGRWGMGSGRRDAARKFFLYTLAGSLLTLLGVIGVVLDEPRSAHGTDHVLAAGTHGDCPDETPRGRRRGARRQPDRVAFTAEHAILGVSRTNGRVHGEGAGVAIPHLAPSGVRRIAARCDDPAFGAPRETRHVRHPALRAAAHTRRGHHYTACPWSVRWPRSASSTRRSARTTKKTSSLSSRTVRCRTSASWC